MVPRLIRRVEMDIRLPVAQIRLRQMVLLGRFVFDLYCFSDELVAFIVPGTGCGATALKRSSRRCYPV